MGLGDKILVVDETTSKIDHTVIRCICGATEGTFFRMFQCSNIFEIFEIFEVQIRSDQILKFKVQICSDLEF